MKNLKLKINIEIEIENSMSRACENIHSILKQIDPSAIITVFNGYEYKVKDLKMKIKGLDC